MVRHQASRIRLTTMPLAVENINEIRLANFFVPRACPLQFGICADGTRNSG